MGLAVQADPTGHEGPHPDDMYQPVFARELLSESDKKAGKKQYEQPEYGIFYHYSEDDGKTVKARGVLFDNASDFLHWMHAEENER